MVSSVSNETAFSIFRVAASHKSPCPVAIAVNLSVSQPGGL